MHVQYEIIPFSDFREEVQSLDAFYGRFTHSHDALRMPFVAHS